MSSQPINNKINEAFDEIFAEESQTNFQQKSPQTNKNQPKITADQYRLLDQVSEIESDMLIEIKDVLTIQKFVQKAGLGSTKGKTLTDEVIGAYKSNADSAMESMNVGEIKAFFQPSSSLPQLTGCASS